MIAVPIGPRTGRFATAASPAYLARRGRPLHPRDLLQHDCLRGRASSGALPPWEFEKGGEVILVEPDGPANRQFRRRGRSGGGRRPRPEPG